MSTRRDRTLVRDHPDLNPYLRQVAIAAGGRPVYWHPREQLLVRFTETGEVQRIPVPTSALLGWITEHEPHQLWGPWRVHLHDQRVLVEHTSVNPVHPLHLGSMRGTVIGSTLAEILRFGGADVQTRYFINDLGHQVRILQRATRAARWHNIPSGHRHDHAVGVLYAFANMTLAGRSNDLDQLITAHPWLTDVVDVDTPLPDPASDPHLIEAMIAAAVDDMGLLGAKIDVFDRETDLTLETRPLTAELATRCDLVRINGTTCLRLPAGIVPVQRGDGSLLYFGRDMLNTQRRHPQKWTAMLHVIGAEQTLLQTMLRDTVPKAPLEHIAFGQISVAGRRFSARQNRLITIDDLARDGGHRRVHEFALALALRRRTRSIDLAHLDSTRPWHTVTAATRVAPATNRDPDRDLLRQLLITLLATPAVLARDAERRTIHATAQQLVLLSRHYTAAARAGTVPAPAQHWFHQTQTRLAALLGIALHDPQ